MLVTCCIHPKQAYYFELHVGDGRWAALKAVWEFRKMFDDTENHGCLG